MPRPTHRMRRTLAAAAVTAVAALAAPIAAGTAYAATPAAAATCTAPLLSRGSTGPAVSLLQQRLHMSTTDGIFGPLTQAAVKTFQSAHRLQADGVVGPLTWTALGGYPCPTPPPVKPPAPTPPPVTKPPAQPGTSAQLDAAIRAYLRGNHASVSVAVYDRRTGVTYQYNAAAEYDTASIVKAQILATVLKHAQDADRGLTSWERAEATQMIRYSDNDAATALWNEVGGGKAVAAVDKALGLVHTTPSSGGTWGLTQTSAADQVILMRDLAYGTPVLNAGSRATELSLMASVTADQKWGVSGGVPAGVTVQLKNGWLPRATHQWRVHSIGHVSGQGRDYVIAVLTQDDSTMGAGVSTIQGVSALVWKALASPLT